MKRFALIAFALASFSAPAAAQYVSDAEPFITAVRERDGNKVTEMIDKRPTIVNSRNLKGETALVTAISRSDELWTTFLLGKGANPNLATAAGDTPLMAAARVGYTQAIEYLLALGAKVDATNRMGETALILAVQQRELDSGEVAPREGRRSGQKGCRGRLFGPRLCQARHAQQNHPHGDRGGRQTIAGQERRSQQLQTLGVVIVAEAGVDLD